MDNYKRITAEEAFEMIETNTQYTILDVRTEEEFEAAHIDGALLIPHTEIVLRAFKELQNKDELILIYCKSGRRSKDAALDLIFMGYTNVYDFGGIESWPYATV